MKLRLERRFPKPYYIIGKLFVEDVYFCDTLEKPWHDNIPYTSCIPTGTYSIKMLFSHKFNRPMPHILGVQGRTEILIHPANYVDELEGCIAVGKNWVKGGLEQSRLYSDSLNTLINQDKESSIEIV